jgi:C-lobe and N-lobe beta barrels of Tf-binding protein B
MGRVKIYIQGPQCIGLRPLESRTSSHVRCCGKGDTQMVTNRLVKLAAVILPAVLTAACGGGGGGGGGGTPAAPVLLPVSPKALMVYLPSSGPAGTTMVSTAIMPTGASNVTSTGTTSRTMTVTGNLANGQTTATTGALPLTCSASGRICSDNTPGYQSIVSSTEAGSGTLAYSNFGLLITPNGTGGNFGGFHTGTPTAVSNLPTSVTATYTGTYRGYAAVGNSVSNQAGNANMTANFTNGTMTGNVTSLTNLSTLASAGYGLNMSGTISGGSYSGTAGFTNATTGAAAGTVTSSAFNGGFYGPNAAETAGAVAIRGTAPTGVQTIVVGAFGAKKN